MWENKELDDIEKLIGERRLKRSMDALENYLLTRQLTPALQQLTDLRNDYRRLSDYWQRGFEDSQRGQVYDHLLHRTFVLLANVRWQNILQNSPFVQTTYRRVRENNTDWSATAIRQQLEKHVADIAVAELEPEHLQEQKLQPLHEEHRRYMNDLFDFLWTSQQWTDSFTRTIAEILLSPTVDWRDQQLMVSGITLSTLLNFGYNKFQLLTDVYTHSSDEHVRQTALVGWVLGCNEEKSRFYTQMNDIVSSLCADETTRQELAELQMQMVYCMMADDDSRKIKDEIIPDLMTANDLVKNGRGLIVNDDERLEDILHPDQAEQKMEKMEERMRQMAEMQKQGSDIYFAGFSQMKRHPFFNDLANWFTPFSPDHPGISNIWNKSRGNKLLQTITAIGAFCDSDKYSLALAFETVLNHLPKEMLDMIEKGEASPMVVGGEVPQENQQQPAFIRRIYLQNLYRFSKLFPYRSQLVDPFSSDVAVFFAKQLFALKENDRHIIELASFFIKKGMNADAAQMLDNVSEENRTAQYYLMLGHLVNGKMASEYFKKAYELEPENTKAIKAYARTLFAAGQYDKALTLFQQVLEQSKNTHATELNIAVCLVNLRRYEEATQLLFRLDYNEPDITVSRILAWALSLAGKYEQAVKIFEKILASGEQQPSDLLNYGYCMWFQHDIRGAMSLFKQYGSDDLERAFFQTDYSVLNERGISDLDIRLMLDALQ